MSKKESILNNIDNIKEWVRINSSLLRLGINPNTALFELDVYNSIEDIRKDEYSIKESAEILSKKKYKRHQPETLRRIYFNIKK